MFSLFSWSAERTKQNLKSANERSYSSLANHHSLRPELITVIESAKLNNLNFRPLEAVSRYRDPQLQVGENYSYLFNLRPNISRCMYMFKHTFCSQ